MLLEKSIFIKSPHRFLSQAMSDLPENVYLNKTTTGCGGTHLCLTNSENYVVIVPYRSAIHNKKSKHNNIIAVEGGVTVDDVVFAINSGVGTHKIMTTYDSFYKVYEALSKLGLLKDFKLCIDEAHVLVSLAKIKGKCFNFLYAHFREFKSFTFLTATPNDQTLLPTPIKDVEFVRVVWELSEKVNIVEQRVKDLTECNKHVIEICKQHLLGEVEGNAYIFYNSVNEIISVIQKLKKMDNFNEDNVNIFCAENPHNDRKISLQLGKRFCGGSFDDCKKINFLTSANYESCDIMDEVGKTYIIVSSKRNSTALTNHILVPQACGRLRNSIYKNQALMIVAGFDDDIYNKDVEQFKAALGRMSSTAKYLIERSRKTKEDGFEEAYLKDIDQFSTNPFIIVNDDLSLDFNEGAMLSEMQTYQAFNTHLQTITSQDVANTIRTVGEVLKVSDESRFLVDEKVDFSRMMRKYVKAIEDSDTSTVELIEKRSEEHKQYVMLLGVDKIKRIGFHKTKLKTAYNLALKFNEVNIEIKSKLSCFRIGGRYTSTHMVSVLQEAYNDLGIDRKANSRDISNYFVVQKTQVVSPTDGKRKQGFKIISDLYTIQD